MLGEWAFLICLKEICTLKTHFLMFNITDLFVVVGALTTWHFGWEMGEWITPFSVGARGTCTNFFSSYNRNLFPLVGSRAPAKLDVICLNMFITCCQSKCYLFGCLVTIKDLFTFICSVKLIISRELNANIGNCLGSTWSGASEKEKDCVPLGM